jgi:tRNA-specific 2-thiouridylase
MNMTSPKHIIVGMSGGVDSSVTALLLKEQGHHVEGIFMKNWEEDDTDTFCRFVINYKLS